MQKGCLELAQALLGASLHKEALVRHLPLTLQMSPGLGCQEA